MILSMLSNLSDCAAVYLASKALFAAGRLHGVPLFLKGPRSLLSVAISLVIHPASIILSKAFFVNYVTGGGHETALKHPQFCSRGILWLSEFAKRTGCTYFVETRRAPHSLGLHSPNEVDTTTSWVLCRQHYVKPMSVSMSGLLKPAYTFRVTTLRVRRASGIHEFYEGTSSNLRITRTLSPCGMETLLEPALQVGPLLATFLST